MLAGLISGTGPGTNLGLGRDAKLCQANPGTYAIGLILAILGSQLSTVTHNVKCLHK